MDQKLAGSIALSVRALTTGTDANSASPSIFSDSFALQNGQKNILPPLTSTHIIYASLEMVQSKMEV